MGLPAPLRELEVSFLTCSLHLVPQTALHLRALQNFRDLRGVSRRTGEEWLVTVQDTEAHVPDVYEEVLGIVPITTLGPRNYCVILDPVGPDGKNQLGQKRVVKVNASCSPGRLTALEGLETPGPLPPLLPPYVHILEASRLFWAPPRPVPLHTQFYLLRPCPVDLLRPPISGRFTDGLFWEHLRGPVRACCPGNFVLILHETNLLVYASPHAPASPWEGWAHFSAGPDRGYFRLREWCPSLATTLLCRWSESVDRL